MPSFEYLAANESVRKEYKKAFLLNIFKKIIAKMRNDNAFMKHIRILFKESTDKRITTCAIVRNNFNYELSGDDIELMYTWFKAFFNKSERRKSFSDDFKRKLYAKQDGLCAVCGEPLGKDYSKIHVDHIIPWTLVGDELQDNYQYLCSFCNESKSCHTDYIFRNMLKLN